MDCLNKRCGHPNSLVLLLTINLNVRSFKKLMECYYKLESQYYILRVFVGLVLIFMVII